MTLYEEIEFRDFTQLCYIRLKQTNKNRQECNSLSDGFIYFLFLPEKNLKQSLLDRHNSHFCAESNFPTAPSDGSRDTRPLREGDEPGLTLRNVLPSKSDDRPFYRMDGSKTVSLKPKEKQQQQ